MFKPILIAAAIVVTSTALSYAHCGTCDHKEKKDSYEKKDGAKDDSGDKDDKTRK